MKDLLKKAENPEPLIEYLDHVTTTEYEPRYDGEYLIELLKDQYNKRLLTRLRNMIGEGIARGENTPEELAGEVMRQLGNMATRRKTESTKDAVSNTYRMITDMQEGKRKPFWSTGSPKFDEVVALGPTKIAFIAGAKKVGKSRFVIDRILHLMRLNPEVKIIWYTWEMKKEEIILNIIAWLTGLDTRLLQGKLGPMTRTQMEAVISKRPIIEQLPIRFITERRNTEEICQELRSLVTERGNHVAIIDNVGLVEHMKGLTTDIQNEDFFARRMVQMRDELDLCIIPIHHLSKEQESKWNKEDYYRPKVTHVRGSSRLVDYANLLILPHRPAKYQDLADRFTPEKWADLQDKFEVDVPINRDGIETRVMFRHELSNSSFYELAAKHQEA